MYCNADIVKTRGAANEVETEGTCEPEMDFSICNV